MLAADKDLRHRRAPAGAADHLVAPVRLLDDVDLGVIDALALQQRAGAGAIGAEHRRIDLDLRHRSLRVDSNGFLRCATYGARDPIRQTPRSQSGRSTPGQLPVRTARARVR